MILLLGGTGYIGSAFVRELETSETPYQIVSRHEVNYYNPSELARVIRETKASFLINAAGYTGKPNVDACEDHKAECLQANAVLPGMIRIACESENLPWGHVSSGCIYTGQRTDGSGFTEENPPNFSFRQNNCSYYSGCKALGEECLTGTEHTYLWRLRIPFNHIDSPRNYLSKLMRYERLHDARNSISHLDQFVRACLDSWEKRIPFGIYNVTNTGSITTRDVVDLLRKHLQLDKRFSFFQDEEEFLRTAAKTPRSNCILDNSKLKNAGIHIDHVREALEKALTNWK